MRYYKFELWRKMNSEDEEERRKADLEWEKSASAYAEIFKAVKEKLPKNFYKAYMSNYGFHDFHLEKIEVINKPYGFGNSGFKNPIEVHIIISNRNSKWELTYKGIKKFIINQEDDTYFDEKRGFDDFGYSEFAIISEKVISHEILFASGSTVMLHFTKISAKKLVE